MERETPLPPPAVTVEAIVRNALAEDLGRGDVTTDACIPPDLPGRAAARARQPLTLAGLPVVEAVYAAVDPAVAVTRAAGEGARLDVGDVACTLSGPAASLLKGERVALNLLQRLCGIATLTRAHVDALGDASTRICDTRKTTPGLRALERYAVRCGGGHNHREDLSSAILIKDNHIAACGGVAEAIGRARARGPHTSRIECEVDRMDQLREALEAGAEVVLLDNFDDEDLRAAVALVAGRAVVEVSGGVTLERIPRIAAAGVDAISIGALTHSAPSVDLGLDWS